MSSEDHRAAYPRQLESREREWIEWVLPADRPGYKEYREQMSSMVVLGQGRRGEGELILGHSTSQPDFTGPLAPVFAYGMIETNFGAISVTVREVSDEQISVEIVSHRSERIPAEFEEARRWTYSNWSPGHVCPQCRKRIREIPMHGVGTAQEHFVLAICPSDQRLWVHDDQTQVNKLIPVTNFYNELMLHKKIRDPKVALDSKRLFGELDTYTDAELTYAFLTYNKLRTKVHIEGRVEADRAEKPSLFHRISKLLKRGTG